MTVKKRFVWIVLDSVGIGAAPDAHRYGEADEVSNTLMHIAEAVDGLNAPNLASLGLGCVHLIPGLVCENPRGAYGKMQERSFGKDTTNGHWEFVGVVLDQPMPVYPEGFPSRIIEPFEAYVGKKVLGNRPASGTVIIEELGEEHVATGRPIVYTSGDSVFQIAAHEDIVPVETLYDWCRYARSILTGKDGVGRVIARPFIGSKGNYKRTGNRKDFSLTFGETVLTRVARAGYPVFGIGKIHDIYGGEGITEAVHTDGNEDGVNQLLKAMDAVDEGILYVNLVDFDAMYGHRNDPVGFARAVEAFDRRLPEIMGRLHEGDTLCITADHGCDPTAPGTDHTREWVPILLYQPNMTSGVTLGERSTFADIGATVADYFGVTGPDVGTSMLPLLKS